MPSVPPSAARWPGAVFVESNATPVYTVGKDRHGEAASHLILVSGEFMARFCCWYALKGSHARRKWRHHSALESLETRQLLAGDLTGHWVAEDLAAALADGERVASWTDRVAGITATSLGEPQLAHRALNQSASVRFQRSDGIDTLTVPAASSPLSGASDFSLAVVFATESQNLNGGTNVWFLNTGLVDGTGFFGTTADWGLVLTAAGQVGAGLGAPVSSLYSTRDSLNDGQPHVAIYTRQAGTMTLYVDGQQVGSRSDASVIDRIATDMTIGAVSGDQFAYSGDIAEIRIYDGELTAEEANDLFRTLDATYGVSPPVAVDDFYEVNEDDVLSVSLEDGLLQNDTGGVSPIVEVLSTPQHGVAVVDPEGSFQYTPDPEFSGTDSFQYRVTDGRDSPAATVHLEVVPVDDPPVGLGEGYYVPAGMPRSVSANAGVLANDFDIDTDPPLTARLLMAPQQGVLELEADGSFEFRPADGFEGVDSFTYVAESAGVDSVEVRVDLFVGSSPVEISEFVAANATTLQTRLRPAVDDDFPSDQLLTPDWVEIRNRTDRPIQMAGFHLTDDLQQPTQWGFPVGTVLEPEGYLIVFASGENVVDPELDELGYLHTNFRLRSAGDELAIAFDDGSVADRIVGEYPPQSPDFSYGLSGDELGYLAAPTPGAPNVGLLQGVVDDVQVSHARGFYETPIEVSLEVTTEQADIYYTLDGSDPTPATGMLYTQPIPISTTVNLRAAAFRENFAPSGTATHTYLYLEDVIQQPAAPDGFPATWGPAGAADYEMDPRIATDTESSLYDPRIADALRSLPTISIAMDPEDFFGAEIGIQSHPTQKGDLWERATSVEFIDFDAFEDTQVDSGIRMVGNASRNANRRKHNMRLAFRDYYEDSSLELPLFGTGEGESHQNLILRGGNGDSWVNPGTARRAQYIRDQWQRDTQLAMGHLTTHQLYAHLYINGLYWGLYHVFERHDAAFMALHLGGDEEDYDAVKDVNGNTAAVEAVSGDIEAWEELMAIVDDVSLSAPETYAQVRQRVDIDNMIDYLLINFYAGNGDWDHNNFRTGRLRDSDGRFQFFSWDAERADINRTNDSGIGPIVLSADDVNFDATGFNKAGRPTRIHQRLMNHEEYRLRFADRVRTHLFDGGPLSPEGVAALWNARADEIRLALVAESARWGDLHSVQTPRTVEGWEQVLQTMNQEYFPVRTGILLEQLRVRGAYPSIDAPQFDIPPGTLPSPAEMGINAPQGLVYVTSDGSDPRVEGGTVSPLATVVNGPVTVAPGVTIKARAFFDGEWSALTEATYAAPMVPADTSNLRLSELHYHPADPTSAELLAGFTDSDEFEFLELVNISEQTVDLSDVRLVQQQVGSSTQGVAFAFAHGSTQSLPPGGRVVVVENGGAFAERYGEGIPVAGVWSGRLSNNRELLTLMAGEAVIQQFRYDDEWHPSTDGDGPALEIVDATAALTQWQQAAGWRPSTRPGGTPVEPSTHGDLDGSGQVSSRDIDLLHAALRVSARASSLDLTGEGQVNAADLTELVMGILGTRVGDADLDGDVDAQQADGRGDGQILLASLGDPERQGWGSGDFNGDGVVTASGDGALLLASLAADLAEDVAQGWSAHDLGLGSSGRPRSTHESTWD